MISFLPFTLVAYFLNSLAVTINKVLLTNLIPDPLVYIFYFSLVSFLAVLVLPFTHIPSLAVFSLASLSTALWTIGAYFMFKALKSGQVSRVIPVIGTLTPLILLAYSSFNQSISINQTWAVGLFVLGLIFLTVGDLKGKLILKELNLEILSSFSFAFSYLLLREAYLQDDFLTVLVWSRLILLPAGIVLLAIPTLRRKILSSKGPLLAPLSGLGLTFIGGQIAGGLSELLLTFSISLANPALVNSLQGTQYIFLLVFAFLLSKKYPKILQESPSFWIWAGKIFAVTLIALGLYILSIPKPNSFNFGVTYSPTYASQLGFDPRSTFTRMLDELNIKLVRLPVYWDEIETFPNQANFLPSDFYLNQAERKGIDIILVVGLRQPRWPECFAPAFVNHLMRQEKDKRTLEFVREEIEHFKKFANIKVWQVENEPFLQYGLCDRINGQTDQLLQAEVNLVKSLDPRPILITDSGELSGWFKAMKLSDQFGFTLYRQVWNPRFGVLEYPLPPAFYTIKNRLVRSLTNHPGQSMISELQAEPWVDGTEKTSDAAIENQVRLMSIPKFKSYIEFARETTFNKIILWGAEWWYFMAAHGHPEYLEYAKGLFNQ